MQKLFLGVLILTLVGCSSDKPVEPTVSGNTGISLTQSSPGVVVGEWQLGDHPKVKFESIEVGENQYEAKLQILPEGGVVQISMTSPTEASVTWNGQTFDGLGALSSEEREALVLMQGELADLLVLPVLALGCTDHEGELGVTAALLVPYQMVSKYLISNRVEEATRLAALAPCAYGFEGVSYDLPRSETISFSVEDPVPNVFGFFPFDGEGSADLLMLINGATTGVRHGPCGSKCRGACGPDCPVTCTVTEEWRCLDDGERLTGVATLEQIYTCGTHEGCRWHDQCFDDCNAEHGCGSWAASTCMHVGVIGCDSQAVFKHGAMNCLSWKDGGGPFDGELEFKYPTETMKSDATLCPPSAEPLHFKMPVEPTESLVGMDLEFTIEGVRVASSQAVGTGFDEKLTIYGEPVGDTLRVFGRAALGKADSIGFLTLYMSTREPPSEEWSWSLENYGYVEFEGEIPIINNGANFQIHLKRDSQHDLEVDARFSLE